MRKKIAISLILAVLCTAYAVLARVKTWGLAIYTLNTTLGKVLVKSWRPAALLAVILWLVAIAVIKTAMKKKAAAKLAATEEEAVQEQSKEAAPAPEKSVQEQSKETAPASAHKHTDTVVLKKNEDNTIGKEDAAP